MHDPSSAEIIRSAGAGDPVALTRVLVATPSVNPQMEAGGAAEGAVAELTAGWLQDWGLATETTEVAPGRYNVVATLDGDGPTLLLNGHMDTVGVGGMTIEPFEAVIEGGRLWGRGSCDMKSGLAVILAVTRRLASHGARPNLIVALTADEEQASAGMYSFVASGMSADLAVVTEPTSLKVMPAHKGFVWIEASFSGRAAHGSRPDLGVDAIRHAALYLASLDEYAAELKSREEHPLLLHGSIHAGTITGGTAPSVYPDACKLLVERRTMPGERPEDVVAEFQRVLNDLVQREPGIDGKLGMTLERPGTEVPEDSPLVQGLLRASDAHGVEPRIEGMTAWVDAALLNEAGIPAVCFGPGDIAQAHTEDEWVDVEQIRTCADVLETFARALAD
jgi:acetylornithine deacetylase